MIAVTVRRTDQAGHVAGDRGDDRTRDEDVEQAERERRRRLGCDRAALCEGREQQADWNEGEQDTADDEADGNVALGQWEAVLAADPPCTAGGNGGGDATRDRPHDPQQGPDRGDAHRAGADEAHLLPEGRADKCLDVGC
jgi:hypothetical protein